MSQDELLRNVASGTLSPEQAAKLLPKEPGEAGPHRLYCKAAAKGGVSLYGVNSRFPVTIYADQWERVLAFADDIRKFIAEHPELPRKAAKATA